MYSSYDNHSKPNIQHNGFGDTWLFNEHENIHFDNE